MFTSFCYVLASELEALGDDLLQDEDTSYLDEVNAPAAPDTVPGEKDATKTQVMQNNANTREVKIHINWKWQTRKESCDLLCSCLALCFALQ